MLTQQDFATMLLRGRVTLANMLKAVLAKEYKGCEPDNWGQAICLKLKLAGLTFSLFMGDYVSTDSMASYYGVSELISGEFGVPITDQNAQSSSTTVIINNPIVLPPNPKPVAYSDFAWNPDHTIYSNAAWAGFTPQIYINGQRFMEMNVEFTVLPSGGFTLASPMVDGDVLYIIF